MEEEKLPIIKDSREDKTKYNFYHYNDVLKINGHPLIDNLNVGDYSISPYQDIFTIEKKTLSDLIGSFSTAKKERQEQGIPDHRQNFKEMWLRSMNMVSKFLMVEGSFVDILGENYRSNFNQNSLIASLMSWSIKYKFNWFFVENEVEGMKAVYYLCKEFLRLKIKGEI